MDLTSRLERVFELTERPDVKTPVAISLPVLGIALSELLLSNGAVEQALWLYTATLLVATLLSFRLPDRTPIFTGFGLIATFRLVNLSMPVFLSVTLFWILIVYLPFTIVGAWVLWRSEEIQPKLNRCGTLVGTPVAIAVGVAFAAVESSLVSVPSLLPTITVEGLRVLALVVILGTVAEEFLFRGVLQSALRRPLGPWLAVAVTSAVFATMHAALGPPAVVVATSAGIIYGLGYELSDSLLVPVVCHSAVNIVLFVVNPAISAGIITISPLS